MFLFDVFDVLNLGEGFRKHFQLTPCFHDEQRTAVYRIRHEVYCRELGWEALREDGCESDGYDRHSLHCLMHTADETRRPVGCTRLVLARPDAPATPLPFEAFCADSLDRSVIDPAALPRNKIAEVSRLAVMPAWRRRRNEASQPVAMNDEDFGNRKQPRFPFIPVGLYMGAVSLAHRHGIDYIFTLTEPRLAQHFGKLGVRVQQIGEPVEHRGLRIPSMLDVQEIVGGIRRFFRPMWKEINLQIEAAYAEEASKAAAVVTRRLPEQAPRLVSE